MMTIWTFTKGFVALAMFWAVIVAGAAVIAPLIERMGQ